MTILSSRCVAGLGCVAIAMALQVSHAAERFVDVEIEPPFDEPLRKQPLLMSVGGAKIIALPDGSRLLVAVSQTAYDPNASAHERVKMLTVAKTKAIREAGARDAPIQVCNVEKSLDTSRVETIDGVEARGEAISEYLSMTETKFSTTVRGLRPIGQWYSADRDMLYMAMGMEIPVSGERQPPRRE